MKHTRTFSRRLSALLLAALLLLGALPAFAAEESTPYKGTVSLDLETRGFGAAGLAMDFISVSLGLDTEKKVADLGFSLLGNGVDVIFAWDNNAPRISVPALGSDVLGLGKDITDTVNAVLERLFAALASGGSGSSETGSDALMTKVNELVRSYAASAEVTEQAGTYSFVMLSGSVGSGKSCTVSMSKDQWKEFWTKLFDTLGENAELVASYIKEYGLFGGSDIEEKLSDSKENIESLAEQTKDWTLTYYYDDTELYALSLGNDSIGILVETNGSISDAAGRALAIGVKNGGTLSTAVTGSLAKTDSGFSAELKIADVITVSFSLVNKKGDTKKVSLDLAYEDMGITLSGTYKPGEVDIAVPGSATRTVTSVDELVSALTELISEAVSDLF